MKNLASRPLLPHSTTHSALYLSYERERRERLLRVMLPGATGIFMLVSVVLIARLFS